MSVIQVLHVVFPINLKDLSLNVTSLKETGEKTVYAPGVSVSWFYISGRSTYPALQTAVAICCLLSILDFRRVKAFNIFLKKWWKYRFL